jgi:hypothetical protein
VLNEQTSTTANKAIIFFIFDVFSLITVSSYEILVHDNKISVEVYFFSACIVK